MALMRRTLIMRLLRRPPRHLSVLIVMYSVEVVRVRRMARLLNRLTPLDNRLRRILTTLIIMVLNESVLLEDLIISVLLNSTRFLLSARFGERSINVPSHLTIGLRTLRHLMSIRYVLSAAYRRIIGAQITVD